MKQLLKQADDDKLAGYLRRLRDDFYFFVCEIWHHTNGYSHTQLGDIDEDVCKWVQHGPKRRGVLAWRKFNKTTIVSVCYALWCLFRDRDHKILVVSRSGEMAKRFLRLARMWIDTVPFLRTLSPRDRKTKRDSGWAFDVHGCAPAKDPSFTACGVEGQLAGKRAHTIIGDDVEEDDNSMTVTQREKLRGQVNEFNAIIYDSGEIIYVGTFHNEESLYKGLAKGYGSDQPGPDGIGGGNVEFRTWPIVYPKEGEKYIGLAPIITERVAKGAKPGDIVAPYRVTVEQVIEQQAVGGRWFSLQYKLQANVRESNRYPLKLNDLIVFDCNADRLPLRVAWGTKDHNGATTAIPEQEIAIAGFEGDRLHQAVRFDDPKDWMAPQLTAMAVDPAGGGKGKAHTTAIGGSLINGFAHLHRLESFEGGARPATTDRIAKMAFEMRARKLFFEGNLAGASEFEDNAWAQQIQTALNRLAKPIGDPIVPEGWGCHVTVIRSSGQKEARIISTVDAWLASHRLVASRQVAGNPNWQQQLSHITSQRNSLTLYDEIDATAILLQQFGFAGGTDIEKGAKSALDRAIDDAIAKRQGASPARWHSVMGAR